jgi:small-conductance mechanosensitive channel
VASPQSRQLADEKEFVDLRERQQLGAARQHAAKVKTRVRPWRSILALILAELAATISRSARAAASSPAISQTAFGAVGHTGSDMVADAAAVSFSLFAAAATAGLAAKAREVLQPRIGLAHAVVVRYAITLLGGLATILITLQLLGVAVTQLLLGGVLASVLIGIAAQQSLSSVFAGMVLLLVRPVDVGDQVLIRSGALGGELRGTVTEIGLTYVRLDTADGPLHLPNAQVLAAAIAPVRHSAPGRSAAGHATDTADSPPEDTGTHSGERATSAPVR